MTGCLHTKFPEAEVDDLDSSVRFDGIRGAHTSRSPLERCVKVLVAEPQAQILGKIIMKKKMTGQNKQFTHQIDVNFSWQ